MRNVIRKVKIFVKKIIKSADEKLRSLSHKGHHSSKTNSNTYCGAQNGQSATSGDASLTSSRSEAPDVPPPPIPHVTANQIPKNQSHDQEPHHESANQNRSSLLLERTGIEIPPPIYPKPQITQMAERRYQRQNRKGGTHEESSVLKKRSRSEGPHGRRKLRNSMHETSNKPSQNKSASNGRHSMYSGHLSEDDNVLMNSGSESQDSDIAEQKWTKNPLVVRKSRKNDKTSKTDKRRSVHNVENRNSMEQSGPSSYQVSQSRESFIHPKRPDNLQGGGQKARFQRMEENRKKRIDMAVTSDEECSPQLRITRLRQRAMMSSHLDDNQKYEDSIHITPVRDESSFKTYQDFQNGISQQNRLSQYDDNRHSKYDENYNMNGDFYQEYTRKQGVKHNKLPSVLPEFLPENRTTTNMANRGENIVQVTKNVPNQNLNVQSVPPKQDKQSRQRGLKLSSESPKLRSFNEVKANQPTLLKKADQKIELNLRSPNSSSDSLDDLIESNIQYLESEIESGKLKRQSGNYSNYQQEKPVQRQLVRENYYTKQEPDEFRSRLQDPRTFVSNKLMSTVTKVEPKVVQKSTVFPSASRSYPSQRTTTGQAPMAKTEHRNVPHSGSATYSPYMQRKTYDVNEDMSKSDSHLNALNTNFTPIQMSYQPTANFAPYPVLDKQTGIITYIQPHDNMNEQAQMTENGLVPGIDSGMFSDVEYNIEVSERIKKWEKKLTPGELEERHTVLNTIKEYESFSDSNQKDSVPDTPVEVRRELWQLTSPTNNSGVGKLSVNLARSASSVSDSNMQEPSSVTYFEPKVVSSETNLHRIFRVVNEPKTRRTVTRTVAKVNPSTESDVSANVQSRRRKPAEVSTHTQSLSNVTLSESEIGSNMQQSWPPMAVDSDSGIRKSWRMSRYEDEINELKELVSDNFRDIRKRFDSDMSETDTKRASPVFREPQVSMPMSASNPGTTQTSGTSKLTLNIQPVTPTISRSPVTIRRKLSDQYKENTPPISPGIPLTPKNERNVPIFRNVPIATKSVATSVQPQPKQTTVQDVKQSSARDRKIPPDVWSPNMESRKGLVSMERVKARTLQTIPFSEDPVWKEIEGLATFEKPDEISKEVNFDEIDELLKLATGGVENLKSRSKPNTAFDSQMKRLTNSDTFMTQSSAQPSILMTQSYTPTSHIEVPNEKHRAMSDSTYPPTHSSKHIFTPPTIQPLKLNSKPAKKSSTSALDEVLEDIRATLQKKPLSPKLMKNLDTSESNSSANPSLQSPLTKSSKSFIFPKDIKKAKTETIPEAKDVVKSSTATPGYDNTHDSWKPPQNEIPPQIVQQLANASYIDPEFTQFPYIINGNYHLDPTLLSEKLKNTGLANESSDEHAANRFNAFANLPANHQALNFKSQPSNHIARPETVNQLKPITHELDQSVDDLRSLAQEVEYKLSQIKSRIVSADEDRLDSILLALRKFAPMTEQTFFNVKFTPNFESEKARRSKLEDALSELEKMYASLDLDDKSIMDRASRREDTITYDNLQGVENSQISNTRDKSDSVEMRRRVSDGSKILRRSQIDEIERQTQNEFEDITKSFQVLLDEVTKQCRTVAQRSSRYSASDSNLFSPSTSAPQYSSQRPPDEIRQEPPRQQLKVETQSQRSVQDSYNTAIKELESVTTGNIRPSETKPVQSVIHLNLDKTKSSVQKTNEIQRNTNLISPTRNLDIQVQSKTIAPNKNSSNVSKTPLVSASNSFVSMATEFFKPSVSKPVTKNVSSGEPKVVSKSTVSLQVELDDAKSKVRSTGRFRKRGNVEHRKSMPAITRNVETQTVETQTDSPPSVSEMKEKFEQYRKASLQDMSSDSSPDFKMGRKTETKTSVGVGNDIDLSSSDDDEVPLSNSKMRRSLSCPDIVALLEDFNKKEKEKEKKLAKVDKTNAKKGTKSTTPKSVKQRHENKLRFRSLHKDDTRVKQTDISTSMTSDDGFESPKTKPPVYPVWKYPGQAENQKGESVKKSEQRKQAFGFERDFTKTTSDTEQDRVFLGTSDQGAPEMDERVIRRRSRSFGGEQQDLEDRPKSFHELVATFEQNPQRREKICTSGLRKCVSEDSMFIDLILQKMYHSESDLYTDEKGHKLTGSGLKLALEMKLETSL